MRGSGWIIRRLARGVLVLVGLLSTVAVPEGVSAADRIHTDTASATRVRTATAKPSIVLILTDDQRWDTLSWMPNVKRLLVAKGVKFTNAFVPNSLCCPSRTSIITGQYSHSTGVWSNGGPYGGFPSFHQDGSTIATWLRHAGYHTALVGKYLNSYAKAAHAGYVPPGWERWISFAGDNGAYFDYDLTLNGHIVHHGHTAADYSTDVLTNKATQFIRQTHGPLFLYFAPTAPHDPFTPAPRDADGCPDLAPYRPPSFGEPDISDKPGYVRNTHWTSTSVGNVGWTRRGQCRTLIDVDRSVARIVASLKATHRLSTTMLVFMSDNGYMWGEHRLLAKPYPYEETSRVPLVVRYDPVTGSPRKEGRIALNLDLAPTFAALAGVGAPGAEGRNLLPVLRGQQVPWRSDFLLEHGKVADPQAFSAPDYCGLHSSRWVYVMYSTGAEELYDLRSDPYELTNVARRPADQDQRRLMRARVLRWCRPLPPGFG
jgi:N-acetylglucosamine-6-sulfatase